jgi:hypothetical protein
MSDAWDDKSDAWSKARENRVRRSAERQGYTLSRSRRRDPKALGYGTYSLTSSHAATASSAPDESMTLAEVEAFLGIKGTDE